MSITNLSKKHWIAFLIIVLCNAVAIAFNAGTLVSISALNIILCLLLIHLYLKESLSDYGLSFKKIHIQIICGLLLAACIAFNLFSTAFSPEVYPLVGRRFMKQFSTGSLLFLYILKTFICATSKELVLRGFLLSLLQKLFTHPFAGTLLCAILSGTAQYFIVGSLFPAVLAAVTGFIYGYLKTIDADNFTIFSLSLTHFLQDITIDIINCW